MDEEKNDPEIEEGETEEVADFIIEKDIFGLPKKNFGSINMYRKVYEEELGSLPALPYAGFGSRFFAWLIDYTLMTLVLFMFNITLGPRYMDDNNIMMALVSIIVPLLYYGLMESSYSGATIGKEMMGLKVIRMDGSPVDFVTSVKRNLAKILSVIGFGYGFWKILFDSEKLCWQDELTDTCVVKTGEMPEDTG